MSALPQTTPALADDANAEEILSYGILTARGAVSLACSFSVEDVVIIDLLQRLKLPAGVFAIDTGRLNEETYEVAESLRERYGLRIDWYFPDREQVEALEREKGLFSFRESLENRKECCFIRKVEPLQRALQPLSGWITGMRRAHGVTRLELQPLEKDALHGDIVKINPLSHWSDDEVWAYAEQQRLPVNRLHRRGYPSIGCAPCTRAIQPGEPARAGRWWWEDPEHKECGLHRK